MKKQIGNLGLSCQLWWKYTKQAFDIFFRKHPWLAIGMALKETVQPLLTLGALGYIGFSNLSLQGIAEKIIIEKAFWIIGVVFAVNLVSLGVRYADIVANVIVKRFQHTQVLNFSRAIAILPAEFTESRRGSDLISEVGGEESRMHIDMVKSVLESGTSMLFVVASFGLVIALDIWVLVVLAGFFLIGIILNALESDVSYEMEKDMRTNKRILGARMRYFDDLQIRIFGFLEPFTRFINASHETVLTQNLEKDKISFRYSIARKIFVGIQWAIIIAYFLWRSSQGVSTSVLIASIGSIALGYKYFEDITHKVGIIFRSRQKLEAYDEIISVAEKIHSREHEKSLFSLVRAPEIRFVDVSYCYVDTEQTAIRNVNAIIPAGHAVAIVGENGSGKSTFAKLLTGVWNATNGEIQIDGRNLQSIRIVDWHKHLRCYAPGFEPFRTLTFAENIHQYRDDVDVDRMLDFSSADFVREYPSGIHTIVGKSFPGGVGLSTGESQRIMVSMILSQNAHVMIFDEILSGIDADAAEKIAKDILAYRGDSTIIFITHSMQIAAQCDMVFGFRDGELVERGKPQTLLKKGGVFADLFRNQSQTFVDVLENQKNPI